MTPRAAFTRVSTNSIRIVAIAASLGGIRAVSHVLEDLPADFPAPILVVQHISPDSPGFLTRVLQARSLLRVKWAEPGELALPGHVYLAPRNRHLIVTGAGTLGLVSSPRVNWVRPSADVLFESIARHYRSQALAIVLTGALFDGAAGAVRIKRAGGWVLAQDRASSVCFDMPRSAILTGAVDYILPLDMLPPALLALVMSSGAADLFRIPCRLPPLPSPDRERAVAICPT